MNSQRENGTIGLVLAYKGTNYGALLQAYATQQIVESLGFPTEIIDYTANKYRRHLKFDLGLVPYGLQQMVKMMRRRNNYPAIDEIHRLNNEQRKRVSDEFRNTLLHNIHNYYGYTRLVAAAKECKAVLIGSDQMWLPGTSFGNHISLRFVPNYIRRISYATSLGVSSYPWYCQHSARLMWKNINYLSVREDQGRSIIKKLCPDKDVRVVIDPTYLLTQEQWEERIPTKRMFRDKYVLCYFLGNSDSQKNCAASYAKRLGLKCITLLSNESISGLDLMFADEVITGASPTEFVNWIRGAECVFTDSFHGLAFSIINRTQFYIFYRRRDDAKQSRNSRIDNILKLWNLEHRLVQNPETVDLTQSAPIEYSAVQSRLAKKRKDSMEFLIEALSF